MRNARIFTWIFTVSYFQCSELNKLILVWFFLFFVFFILFVFLFHDVIMVGIANSRLLAIFSICYIPIGTELLLGDYPLLILT